MQGTEKGSSCGRSCRSVRLGLDTKPGSIRGQLCSRPHLRVRLKRKLRSRHIGVGEPRVSVLPHTHGTEDQSTLPSVPGCLPVPAVVGTHPACPGEDSGPPPGPHPASALQPSPSRPPRRGFGLRPCPFPSNVCLCGSGVGARPGRVVLAATLASSLGLGPALVGVSGGPLRRFGGGKFQEAAHGYSGPLHRGDGRDGLPRQRGARRRPGAGPRWSRSLRYTSLLGRLGGRGRL